MEFILIVALVWLLDDNSKSKLKNEVKKVIKGEV